MDYIKKLKHYLIDTHINSEIFKLNEIEIKTSLEFLDFTENILLPDISNYKCKDEKELVIKKALVYLFVHGIRSYKSALLLFLNGYYTNGMVVVRNLMDVNFNINYILEDNSESYNRAYTYIDSLSKWTNDTIRNIAYISSNSTLYQKYTYLSDYVHANYLGTSENINKEGKLTIYPTEYKINDGLALNNAVYYYLLETICKYFNIDINKRKKVIKTKTFMNYLDEFKKYNFSKRYYEK